MRFNRQVIYLDFDGVIAASAIECVNTAMCAMEELEKNSIEDDVSITDCEKIKHLAISNRYLVLPPEHYYCLIKAVTAFVHEVDVEPSRIAERFNIEKLEVREDTLRQFKYLFFNKRSRDNDENSDVKWYLENPATPFIHELMRLLEGRNVRVEIVSRKDEASILKWVSSSPFQFDSIFGNGALNSENNEKFALISKLQAQRGNAKAIFIDDAPSELFDFDWASIGVTPLVAGWGYNQLEDNKSEIITNVKEWLNDLSY